MWFMRMFHWIISYLECSQTKFESLSYWNFLTEIKLISETKKNFEERILPTSCHTVKICNNISGKNKILYHRWLLQVETSLTFGITINTWNCMLHKSNIGYLWLLGSYAIYAATILLVLSTQVDNWVFFAKFQFPEV